eukprot:2674020-Pyramimonas_sp.AAC.2
MSLTTCPLPSRWHSAQYGVSGVSCNPYSYLLFPVSRVLALHCLILLSVLKACSFPAYCRCLALRIYSIPRKPPCLSSVVRLRQQRSSVSSTHPPSPRPPVLFESLPFYGSFQDMCRLLAFWAGGIAVAVI